VFVCDIRRVAAELGWAPAVGVQEGVERLALWVEKNREIFGKLYSWLCIVEESSEKGAGYGRGGFCREFSRWRACPPRIPGQLRVTHTFSVGASRITIWPYFVHNITIKIAKTQKLSSDAYWHAFWDMLSIIYTRHLGEKYLWVWA